jgi:hypothetical protein
MRMELPYPSRQLITHFMTCASNGSTDWTEDRACSSDGYWWVALQPTPETIVFSPLRAGPWHSTDRSRRLHALSPPRPARHRYTASDDNRVTSAVIPTRGFLLSSDRLCWHATSDRERHYTRTLFHNILAYGSSVRTYQVGSSTEQTSERSEHLTLAHSSALKAGVTVWFALVQLNLRIEALLPLSLAILFSHLSGT